MGYNPLHQMKNLTSGRACRRRQDWSGEERQVLQLLLPFNLSKVYPEINKYITLEGAKRLLLWD